jgi:hypothetical protein
MMRRGLERGSAGKPAWIDHGQRDGVDQHPRVGGARCGEKPVAWTFFDHSALAHDHHPPTDRANNRKVMLMKASARRISLVSYKLPWPWIDPDKALPWVEQSNAAQRRFPIRHLLSNR